MASRNVMTSMSRQRPTFSTSSRVRAREDNPGVKNDPDIIETAEKSPLNAVLQENPQLLAGVHRFIEVVQEEGERARR